MPRFGADRETVCGAAAANRNVLPVQRVDMLVQMLSAEHKLCARGEPSVTVQAALTRTGRGRLEGQLQSTHARLFEFEDARELTEEDGLLQDMDKAPVLPPQLVLLVALSKVFLPSHGSVGPLGLRWNGVPKPGRWRGRS